jgi:hypothetical protein
MAVENAANAELLIRARRSNRPICAIRNPDLNFYGGSECDADDDPRSLRSPRP